MNRRLVPDTNGMSAFTPTCGQTTMNNEWRRRVRAFPVHFKWKPIHRGGAGPAAVFFNMQVAVFVRVLLG